MAKAICSGGASAIKSFSPSIAISSIPVPTVPGLVAHPALSAELQIGILSIVDETGSATLGDLVENLAQPHAATAALALVAAGALDIEPVALIDANTRLTRRSKVAEGCEMQADAPPPANPLPDSITPVQRAAFEPQVYLIKTASLSHVRRVEQLKRPGVYVAWTDEASGYVGTGGDIAKRIAMGNHLDAPAQVVAIVDRNGNLTPEDAQVAERIAHQYVEHAKMFGRLNSLPMGTSVEPERYDEIRLFVSNAMMLLRRDGILTSSLNARQLLAGPRSMSDSKVVPIPGDGILHELDGLGVFARAANVGKDWILLRGSTVRREVVPSANSSVALRRAEWLHAGILRDLGHAYEVVSNIRFDSASGAAQFVSGSKGRSWTPIGPATSSDLLALH